MNTTYDVKFWEIQRRTGRKTPAFLVRWTVARQHKSKSFRTKGLADAFLSDLRQAAKLGESFDLATGLPMSMQAPEPAGPTFLEFAQSHLLRRWRTSAARTRETDAYALLTLIPALVADVPGRPADEDLRAVLRTHTLLPEGRRAALTSAQAAVSSWLEKASLPLSDLGEAAVLRLALDAISVTFAGKPAGANTVRRKRAILHHLLEQAVEQKLFTSNPLDEIKWTPPKAAPLSTLEQSSTRCRLADSSTLCRRSGTSAVLASRPCSPASTTRRCVRRRLRTCERRTAPCRKRAGA